MKRIQMQINITTGDMNHENRVRLRWRHPILRLIVFTVIGLFLGAVAPTYVSADAGTVKFSNDLPTGVYPLVAGQTYTLDMTEPGPADMDGADCYVRNGVPQPCSFMGWIHTDASGYASQGPWTCTSTVTSVDKICWNDGTGNPDMSNCTNETTHICDTTDPIVSIDSSSSPQTGFYGTVDDGYGSGYHFSNDVSVSFQDLTTGLFYNFADEYNWAGNRSASGRLILPPAVNTYTSWDSLFWGVPPAGAHICGRTYEWRVGIVDAVGNWTFESYYYTPQAGDGCIEIVDCVGHWQNNGACNTTCGSGLEQQVYVIDTPAQNGGTACPNNAGDTHWGPNTCTNVSGCTCEGTLPDWPAHIDCNAPPTGVGQSYSYDPTCSTPCSYTCGGSYTWNGTSCVKCGDGIVNGSDQCDDGNTNNGDGCSSSCAWETKTNTCTAKPGAATTIYNTVSSYPQTCTASNGTSCTTWNPVNDATTEYNNTSANPTTACQYTCAGGYIWSGGVCVLPVSCGDGTVNGTDQCDDGNTNNGDGCSSSCAWETKTNTCTAKPGAATTIYNTVSSYPQTCTASNGTSCTTWNPVNDATTDYNNAPANPTTACQYTCAGGYIWSGGICIVPASCGDGTVNGSDQCDDGNTNNGDGCSSSCAWEIKTFTCTAKVGGATTAYNTVSSYPQTCIASNGTTCTAWNLPDDATTEYNITGSATSCRYNCAATYTWSGTACINCGDGIVNGSDQCDDGNTTNGDGCSSTCQIESCSTPPNAPGPTTTGCEYYDAGTGTCWVKELAFQISATAATATCPGGIAYYEVCRTNDITGTGNCMVTDISHPSNLPSPQFTVSGTHIPTNGSRRGYFFKAIDSQGNASVNNTPAYIRIDYTNPDINISNDGALCPNVTLTASDDANGSGIAEVRIKWSSDATPALNASCTAGGTVVASGPISNFQLTVPSGTNTLTVCARDKTGRFISANTLITEDASCGTDGACGQNAGIYTPLDISWPDPASGGFCSAGSLREALPIAFPNVGSSAAWHCDGPSGVNVTCTATRPETNECELTVSMDIDPVSAYTGDAISFTGNVSIPLHCETAEVPDYEYTWDWNGDGSDVDTFSSSLDSYSATHAYGTAGTFNPKLTVVKIPSGSTGIDTGRVDIHNAGECMVKVDAGATPLSPLVNEDVNFTSSATLENCGSTTPLFQYTNRESALNQNLANNVHYSNFATYHDELYIIWNEVPEAGTSAKIFVKKYNSASDNWELVTPSLGGLSMVAQTTSAPVLIVYNDELYAIFGIDLSAGAAGIRVAKYMGGTTWTRVDVGTLIYGVVGDYYSSSPTAAVYNGKLYVFWENCETAMDRCFITGKKYDGTDWTYIKLFDHILNHLPGRDAKMPTAKVYKGDLYVAWAEDPDLQIRVKKYDGTNWTFVDGAAQTIQYGPFGNDNLGGTPRLEVYNGLLYAVWREGLTHSAQIVYRTYDGSTWSTEDPLAVGLGRHAPYVAEYEGNLYFTWRTDDNMTFHELDGFTLTTPEEYLPYSLKDYGGFTPRFGGVPIFAHNGDLYLSTGDPQNPSTLRLKVAKFGLVADEIASYGWNFGDGNTSSAQNTSHAYTNPIIYNALLTVTTKSGKTGTAEIPIDVRDFALKCSFDPIFGRAPLDVAMSFSRKSSSGTPSFNFYAHKDGADLQNAVLLADDTIPIFKQYGESARGDGRYLDYNSDNILDEYDAKLLEEYGVTGCPLNKFCDLDDSGNFNNPLDTDVAEYLDFIHRTPGKYEDTLSHTYTEGGDFIATITKRDTNGNYAECSETVSVLPPRPCNIALNLSSNITEGYIDSDGDLDVAFAANAVASESCEDLVVSFDYGDGTALVVPPLGGGLVWDPGADLLHGFTSPDTYQVVLTGGTSSVPSMESEEITIIVHEDDDTPPVLRASGSNPGTWYTSPQNLLFEAEDLESGIGDARYSWSDTLSDACDDGGQVFSNRNKRDTLAFQSYLLEPPLEGHYTLYLCARNRSMKPTPGNRSEATYEYNLDMTSPDNPKFFVGREGGIDVNGKTFDTIDLSIDYEWSEAFDAHSGVKEYVIRLQDQDGEVVHKSDVIKHDKDPHTTSVKYTMLEDKTVYSYSIMTIDVAGNLAPSWKYGGSFLISINPDVCELFCAAIAPKSGFVGDFLPFEGTVLESGVCPGVLTVDGWTFGDGNSDPSLAILHSYASDGEYVAELRAHNADVGVSCSDTTNVSITRKVCEFDLSVLANGVNPLSGSAPLDASFEAVVSNPKNCDPVAPYTYAWDFAFDGTTFNSSSDLPSPSHTYDIGSYTAKLRVTRDGTLRTADVVIDVGSCGLTAAIQNPAEDPYEILVGNSVNFIGKADTSCPAPVTYSWDFGNGRTWNGMTAISSYTLPGDYVVTLTAHQGAETAIDTMTIRAVGMDFAHYLPAESYIPRMMLAGKDYEVRITYQNIGSTVWDPSSPKYYGLYSQNPPLNATFSSKKYHFVDRLVQPGDIYTFTFIVTAPLTPGTYNLQWQMGSDPVIDIATTEIDSVDYFQAPMDNIEIEVMDSVWAANTHNTAYGGDVGPIVYGNPAGSFYEDKYPYMGVTIADNPINDPASPHYGKYFISGEAYSTYYGILDYGDFDNSDPLNPVYSDVWARVVGTNGEWGIVEGEATFSSTGVTLSFNNLPAGMTDDDKADMCGKYRLDVLSISPGDPLREPPVSTRYAVCIDLSTGVAYGYAWSGVYGWLRMAESEATASPEIVDSQMNLVDATMPSGASYAFTTDWRASPLIEVVLAADPAPVPGVDENGDPVTIGDWLKSAFAEVKCTLVDGVTPCNTPLTYMLLEVPSTLGSCPQEIKDYTISAGSPVAVSSQKWYCAAAMAPGEKGKYGFSEKPVVFNVDPVAPVVTSNYAHDGQWVFSDQAITISARDYGSSQTIESIAYCWGATCNPYDPTGGGWVDVDGDGLGDGGIITPGNGLTRDFMAKMRASHELTVDFNVNETLRFQADDGVVDPFVNTGNAHSYFNLSPITQVVVKIDKDSLDIDALCEPPYTVWQYWFKDNPPDPELVTIRLSSYGSSPVVASKYSWDIDPFDENCNGGTPTHLNPPPSPFDEMLDVITFGASGQHTIYLCALNEAGHSVRRSEICGNDHDAPVNWEVNHPNACIKGNQGASGDDNSLIDVDILIGRDDLSGMSEDSADYLLEFSATDPSEQTQAGVCSSTWLDYLDSFVDETPTADEYVFEANHGQCYKFRYTVKDHVKNEETFFSTDVTIVDTVPPIPDGDEPRTDFDNSVWYTSDQISEFFFIEETCGNVVYGTSDNQPPKCTICGQDGGFEVEGVSEECTYEANYNNPSHDDVCDTAGNCVASGTLIDSESIKCDKTAPINGSVNNDTDYQKTPAISVPVDPGDDPLSHDGETLSGLSTYTDDYQLDIASSPLVDGKCVAPLSAFADSGVGEVAAQNATYDYTASVSNCYRFRYMVRDGAGENAPWKGNEVYFENGLDGLPHFTPVDLDLPVIDNSAQETPALDDDDDDQNGVNDNWHNVGGTAYQVTFHDHESSLRTCEYRAADAAGVTTYIDWTEVDDLETAPLDAVFPVTADQFSPAGTHVGAYATPWEVDFDALIEGPNSISLRCDDLAGNITNEANVFVIQKDITPPHADEIPDTQDAPGMNYGIQIDGGGDSTDVPLFSLTISMSDPLSGMALMRFSCDGTDWSPWEPYGAIKGLDISDNLYGCTDIFGSKRVYGRFMDHAGNETMENISDTIYYDTELSTGIPPIPEGYASADLTIDFNWTSSRPGNPDPVGSPIVDHKLTIYDADTGLAIPGAIEISTGTVTHYSWKGDVLLGIPSPQPDKAYQATVTVIEESGWSSTSNPSAVVRTLPIKMTAQSDVHRVGDGSLSDITIAEIGDGTQPFECGPGKLEFETDDISVWEIPAGTDYDDFAADPRGSAPIKLIKGIDYDFRCDAASRRLVLSFIGDAAEDLEIRSGLYYVAGNVDYVYDPDAYTDTAISPDHKTEEELMLALPFRNGIEDWSSIGREGALNGNPVYTDWGKVGKGLILDGNDDYIEYQGAVADLRLGAYHELTIESWVNLPVVEEGGLIGNNSEDYSMKIMDNGHVQFIVGKISPFSVESNDSVTPGQWHHVAAVVNYDAVLLKSTVNIYIDGSLSKTQTGTGSITDDNSPFFIGKTKDGEYLNGIIDDFRIYNVALTADEVATDYRRLIPEKDVDAGSKNWVGPAIENDQGMKAIKLQGVSDGDPLTYQLIPGAPCWSGCTPVSRVDVSINLHNSGGADDSKSEYNLPPVDYPIADLYDYYDYRIDLFDAYGNDVDFKEALWFNPSLTVASRAEFQLDFDDRISRVQIEGDPEVAGRSNGTGSKFLRTANSNTNIALNPDLSNPELPRPNGAADFLKRVTNDTGSLQEQNFMEFQVMAAAPTAPILDGLGPESDNDMSLEDLAYYFEGNTGILRDGSASLNYSNISQEYDPSTPGELSNAVVFGTGPTGAQILIKENGEYYMTFWPLVEGHAFLNAVNVANGETSAFTFGLRKFNKLLSLDYGGGTGARPYIVQHLAIQETAANGDKTVKNDKILFKNFYRSDDNTSEFYTTDTTNFYEWADNGTYPVDESFQWTMFPTIRQNPTDKIQTTDEFIFNGGAYDEQYTSFRGAGVINATDEVILLAHASYLMDGEQVKYGIGSSVEPIVCLNLTAQECCDLGYWEYCIGGPGRELDVTIAIVGAAHGKYVIEEEVSTSATTAISFDENVLPYEEVRTIVTENISKLTRNLDLNAAPYNPSIVMSPQNETIIAPNHLITGISDELVFPSVEALFAQAAGGTNPSGNPVGGIIYNRGGEKILLISAGDKDHSPDGFTITIGDSVLPSDQSWTIVLQGGRMLFKGDVMGSGNLAVIALKKRGVESDEADSSNRMNGNILISPDVQNLKVSMFAEGSLLSYDDVKLDPVTHKPDPNGVDPLGVYDGFEHIPAEITYWKDRLKNQLYILGFITSQNTVGGTYQVNSGCVEDECDTDIVAGIPNFDSLLLPYDNGENPVTLSAYRNLGSDALDYKKNVALRFDLKSFRTYKRKMVRENDQNLNGVADSFEHYDVNGNPTDDDSNLDGKPDYCQIQYFPCDYEGSDPDLQDCPSGTPAPGVFTDCSLDTNYPNDPWILIPAIEGAEPAPRFDGISWEDSNDTPDDEGGLIFYNNLAFPNYPDGVDPNIDLDATPIEGYNPVHPLMYEAALILEQDQSMLKKPPILFMVTAPISGEEVLR